MGNLELIQGTLDMLILRTLAWQPQHGYGISEWLRTQSAGAFDVQDAALYKALRRLESRGWVDSHWGLSDNNRRARFYRLTRTGRAQLRAEKAAFEEYVRAVFDVMDPSAGEA